MKKMISSLFFVILPVCWMVLAHSPSSAEAAAFETSSRVRGINGVGLELKKGDFDFSFIAMGHIYGSHGSSPNVWDRSPNSPAVRLMFNLDDIIAMNPDFIVSLGDMVLSACDEAELFVLKNAFLDKLSSPVFNAIGNHDRACGAETYRKEFGETNFTFIYGNSLFLFVDALDQDPSQILKALKEAQGRPSVKNIFVMVHELIFLANQPALRPVLEKSNIRENYTENISHFDLFQEISRDKHVYFLGGDIGADEERSYSTFYHRDGQMHYAATGLGDTDNDAVLRFHVSSIGVRIEPVSLSGEDMQEIEFYGVKFWKQYFRRQGRILRKIQRHPKYVLAGAFAGIIVLLFSMGAITLIRMRRKP